MLSVLPLDTPNVEYNEKLANAAFNAYCVLECFDDMKVQIEQYSDGTEIVNEEFVNRIREHWDDFKQIFLKTLIVVQGCMVAPIQAIAKRLAIRMPFSQEGKFSVSASAFNKKVQGERSRSELCSGMCLDEASTKKLIQAMKDELTKKMGWLQEWIQNEETTTDEDFSSFLKYVAASTSLPPGEQLLVGCQARDQYTPFPQAETCHLLIKFSPEPCEKLGCSDKTKYEFIRSLNFVFDVEGFIIL